MNSTDEIQIDETLRRLERRISRLEAHLGLPPPKEQGVPESAAPRTESPGFPRLSTAGLEWRIGEFGLAWVGSTILFLGLVFLMAYTFGQGYHLLATLVGYFAASGLYLLSGIWKTGYAHLSRLLLVLSLTLLWYTTLRLHFFTPSPLLVNPYLALFLVLAAVAIQFCVASARQLRFLAAVALLLGLISALAGDDAAITLPLTFALSIATAWLARRKDWSSLLNAGIPLTYLTIVLWLLNNPLVGRPVQAAANDGHSIVYLFLCAAAYVWPSFGLPRGARLLAARILALLSNCLLFSLVLLFTVATFLRPDYPAAAMAAAAFMLAISVLHWSMSHEPLAPSLYACFGYMALSAGIYGLAGIPSAFLWLALQSLLVLSMSLWFRSRILVVINFLIYVGILAAYAAIAHPTNAVNFSFAFVALASARVMNWKRERLTLRTELMRNLYLAIAFLLILYSLYRALPSSYVALSWTVAALGYFALSLLLNNIKYRWMALFQLLATVFYLFLVDLARMDPRFRVLAFLFLGLMALGISLSYSKLRHLLNKKDGAESKPPD